MSRELGVVENGQPLPGWVMRCDQAGCPTRSDVRPSKHDLPLSEFVAAGWFVAAVYGDYCPTCANRAGGLAVLVRSTSGPNRPHRLLTAASS